MTIKPIALSFKNTKEDIKLHKWIITHSNMSGFIKDILRAAMENESNRNIEPKTLEQNNNQNNDSLIELNF